MPSTRHPGRRALLLGAGVTALMVVMAGPVPAGQLRLSPQPPFAPLGYLDARDQPSSRLDLRRVVLGQQGSRLTLELRTERPWRTRDLAPGDRLCVELSQLDDGAVQGRVCVGPDQADTVLRYQSVDTAGRAGRWQHVVADVSRPDGRTVSASVPAAALDLAPGTVRWAVASAWTNPNVCIDGCFDRAPDAGTYRSSLRVLAEPRCFGASARGSRAPCGGSVLRHLLYPTPSGAEIVPSSECRPFAAERFGSAFHPCAFGLTDKHRVATVALIGDSHARHWRGALEVVAQARRWRGISITRPGCPFSTQVPLSPDLGPATCVALHRAIIRWLGANPQITTIFVSDWAQPVSGPQGGAGGYGGGSAAFAAMLERVPRSVRHIYVLRDIPATTIGAASCVTAARAARRPLRAACGTPRAAALTPDPGASAR